MIGEIERHLGRKLDERRFGTIPTLNDVPPEMIAELRALALPEDASLAEWYLHLHVADPGHRAFRSEFIRDVIRGGMDPARWGHRDVLVIVHADEEDMLTMSAAGVRAALADLDGERWFCVAVADAAEVNRRDDEVAWGAPGVLVRDVPYWWRSGVPSAMVLSVGGALVGRPVGELRHVPDERLDVALRRWIALRMSWLARQSSVDLAAVDVDQVIAAADGDAKVVTLDARVAISALLAEARAPFDPRIHVHGFVGPDEWYAG